MKRLGDPLEGLDDLVRAVDDTTEELDQVRRARVHQRLQLVLADEPAGDGRAGASRRRLTARRAAGGALAMAGLAAGGLLVARHLSATVDPTGLRAVAPPPEATAPASAGPTTSAPTVPAASTANPPRPTGAAQTPLALRPFALIGAPLAGELALLDRDVDRLAVPDGATARARIGNRGALAVIGPAEIGSRRDAPGELELRSGRIVVRIDARQDSPVVVRAGGLVLVSQSAVFAVDMTGGHPRVLVETGTVWAESGTDARARELAPGPAIVPGHSVPGDASDLSRILERERGALVPPGPGTPVSLELPAGAGDIFVDGQWLGRTPLSVSLSPGDHDVRLTRRGSRTRRERLRVGDKPIRRRLAAPAELPAPAPVTVAPGSTSPTATATPTPGSPSPTVTANPAPGSTSPTATPDRAPSQPAAPPSPPPAPPSESAAPQPGSPRPASAAKEAARLYRVAEAKLASGDAAGGEAILRRILREFGGEPLAAVAAFDLAVRAFREGKYADAAELARAARERGGPLADSARRLEERARAAGRLP
jgi:hypothetical protein